MPTASEPYILVAVLVAAVIVARLVLGFLRWRRLSERQRLYRAYLRTEGWKRLRREALERDGRRCRLCNAGEALQVHHRYYPEQLGTETVDALTTLCGACHEAVAHRDSAVLPWLPPPFGGWR